MAITKTLEQEVVILPLGLHPKGKERLLWERVEENIWGADPNYVPSLTIGRKGEEREFFILRHGEKAIGRAAATMDQKNKDVGFIDDFVINLEDKEYAPMLIKHCLSVLWGKGVSRVMVRSYNFLGLAESNGGPPPFGLPYTPQGYINLFERVGFVRYKEWQSFRMSTPPVSLEEIERGNELLRSLRLKFKPLNVLSRREVEEYNKLLLNTLGGHFDYNPQAIKTSFLGRILAWFIFKLARRRIYVLWHKSRGIIAYYSFHPDYNVALKHMGRVSWLKLLNPRFLLSLRGVKRAVIGAQAHAEALRGNGLWKAMQSFRLKKYGEEGYTEFDTGRVLSENIPAVRAAKAMFAKYGERFTKYYTLVHKFQDEG
jgi:hypothetical protein